MGTQINAGKAHGDDNRIGLQPNKKYTLYKEIQGENRIGGQEVREYFLRSSVGT